MTKMNKFMRIETIYGDVNFLRTDLIQGFSIDSKGPQVPGIESEVYFAILVSEVGKFCIFEGSHAGCETCVNIFFDAM